MFKIVGKVPFKFRIIIEVLIILIICGSYYQFFYKPQVEEIKRLKRKYETVALKVARLRPIVLSYDKFKKEFEIVNEQFKKILTVLPNEKDYNVLYDQIVGLAEGYGLRVTLFQPKGVRKVNNFYSSVNFNMNMEGGFLDVVNFLYRINYLNKIININSIKVKPVRDKEGNLNLKVSMSLNSYKFNVSSGAKK